jgi:hypothetical protein
MTFLPNNQLRELMMFSAIADKEARSDLTLGYLKDENDYTSNFTGALRRIINSNSRSGLSATSFLLTHAEERQIGADAAIILTRGKQSKVAVFEGKWPRFAAVRYRWDYYQKSVGMSHFSHQLDRQKRWSGAIAVFEMFYCEYQFGRQPPFLDKFGSSCVWHDDMQFFRGRKPNPNGVWTRRELKAVLRSKRLTVSDVMAEFGACKKGVPIQIVDPQAIGREYDLPSTILAVNAGLESKDRRE